MVDQAPLKDKNGVRESPPRAAARNLSELMSDVMMLAELQGQLAMVEFRQELRKLVPSVAVLAGGIILAFCCLPLALVCIALMLDEWTQLSRPVAFLVTLGGAVLLALLLVLGSVWYMRSSIGLLDRSRAELSLNVKWIRNMLKRMGTSDSRQGKFGAETGHSW
jgi:uncharacterized membrane protein YqjE